VFQCNYCGAQFLEHKTNCSNCGALIKAIPVEVIDRANGASTGPTTKEAKSIRAICANYEETRNLRLDETINAKSMKTVRSSFNLPTDETVIMVYDDTLMGSNKTGFAICQGGLYWKNDWTTETRRNFLTWQVFAERTIRLDEFTIQLGHSDKINTAGVGDKAAREQMVALLNEIKVLVNS
jgi:hypothetical protein